MKLFLQIIFVLFTSTTLNSQWRSTQFKELGQEDGLSGTIRDIVQDSLGVIYMVCELGLYIYDGSELTLLKHSSQDSNSISANLINRVYLSSDGYIWTSHHLSGLSRYDPMTGIFKRIALPPITYSTLTGAIAITEDIDKNIWVGGHHGRLLKLNTENSRFTEYQPDWLDTLIDNRRLDVTSIIQDQYDPNKLWLTIHGNNDKDAPLINYGIYTFDKVNETFSSIPCNGRITYQNDNGILWGNYWGPLVTSFDPRTNKCTVYNYDTLMINNGVVKGAAVSFDIASWKGTNVIGTSGIVRLDNEGNTAVEFPNLIDEPINTLFEDQDENLWMGSANGIKIYNPKDQAIDYFSIEKFDNVSGRIYPGRLAYYHSDKCIYLLNPLGKDNDRIYKIPIDKNKQQSYIETNLDLSGLTTDSIGQLWVYGSGKLYTLDANYNKLIKVSENLQPKHDVHRVYYLKTSVDGLVAGISSGYFFWIDPLKETQEFLLFDDIPAHNKNEAFSGFHFLNKNRVLLFSDRRIFVLDILTKKITHLNWKESFKSELIDIRNAFISDNKTLWVNNLSDLYQFIIQDDSLKLIKTYSIEDGILSPTMNQTIEDVNNRIWIFTNSGVDCLDPSTNEIRNYGLAEGVPMAYNDPLQIANISNERLASISLKGFMMWDPTMLWESSKAPNVNILIKKVKVNGKNISLTQTNSTAYIVALNDRREVVDISFQGLSMTDQKLINYKYRLNDKWIDLGNQNSLTLTSLDYGKTLLELSTSDLSFSEKKVTSLLLLVPTPIYVRGWFIAISSLLLFYLIFFLIKRWVTKEEQRKREKINTEKQMTELELKALRSQMNPHFMFNSLNSIKTYILEAQPDIAADYLSQFAHLLRKILQNSREKYITLKEELETLMLYISLEQFRFERAFQLEYCLDEEIDLEDIIIPPLILQPYVENAIWHGLMNKGAGGKLLIDIKNMESFIECTIDDNGVGRKKAKSLKSLSAQKHKSLGMGITESRINLQNYKKDFGIQVRVVDKEDVDKNPIGTKVIITLPKSSNQ